MMTIKALTSFVTISLFHSNDFFFTYALISIRSMRTKRRTISAQGGNVVI